MTQRVCAVSPPFARVAGVCWLKQRPVCWHVHVMCWCACAYGTIYDLLYCLWSNAVKRGQTHRMTKFRPVDCETKQPIRFDPGFISDTIYTGVFVALVSTVVVMTMHVRTFERAYALLAADGACPSPATHGAAGGADAPAPHTRPPPPTHTHTCVGRVYTYPPHRLPWHRLVLVCVQVPGGACACACACVGRMRGWSWRVWRALLRAPEHQGCVSSRLGCMVALLPLCCAVLCCAVLCCAVLCCAVLCCAVLCCAVLCCAVLCCAVSPRGCSRSDEQVQRGGAGPGRGRERGSVRRPAGRRRHDLGLQVGVMLVCVR
jgi:hypothetical protein